MSIAINPETMYWAEKSMEMAAKAAAIREAYRDAKAVGKKVSKSLSRAHRVVSKQYGKAMPRFNIKKTIRQTKHQLLRDVRNRQQLARDRRRASSRRPSGPRGTTARSALGRRATYPVARSSRAFRKARKVTSKVSSFAKRHFDDYGTITRDHACYLGFETHGSIDRVWNILGEAVGKAILAKVKMYPRSYDEVLDWNYETLTLGFKRVNYPLGADELVSVVKTLTVTDTYESFCAVLSAEMKLQADADPAVAPDTDTVARYLDSVIIETAPSGRRYTVKMDDVGESVIKLGASQKIRLQNVTPNDAGGKELDVTGTNPLNGRKYVFNNHRAKLISKVQETHPQYDFFGLVTDRGVNPGYQPATEDDPLNHPPAANQVFTNCKESVKIGMKAGGMKHENTTFTMTHKLRTFVERIYYAGFDKGSWGGCTWFAFERNYRQGSGATEDQIIIGFNRELSMSAHCQFKTQKSMLKHYDNTDLGDLATP